jgi:hypothetical protein
MASIPQIIEGSALGGVVGGAAEATGAGSIPTASSVTGYLDFLVHAWNTLISRSLWQRIAEGVIGGALILVAVAHMTGAPGVVRKIAKVAP